MAPCVSVQIKNYKNNKVIEIRIPVALSLALYALNLYK